MSIRPASTAARSVRFHDSTLAPIVLSSLGRATRARTPSSSSCRRALPTISWASSRGNGLSRYSWTIQAAHMAWPTRTRSSTGLGRASISAFLAAHHSRAARHDDSLVGSTPSWRQETEYILPLYLAIQPLREATHVMVSLRAIGL